MKPNFDTQIFQPITFLGLLSKTVELDGDVDGDRIAKGYKQLQEVCKTINDTDVYTTPFIRLHTVYGRKMHLTDYVYSHKN